MITVIFWHVDFVGSVKTVRLFFFAVHCVFVLGVIFFKALPQLDKHCSVGRSSWIHPTIHLRVTCQGVDGQMEKAGYAVGMGAWLMMVKSKLRRQSNETNTIY